MDYETSRRDTKSIFIHFFDFPLMRCFLAITPNGHTLQIKNVNPEMTGCRETKKTVKRLG